MSDPYIGEIKLVGFNFPPVGWALCDGQLLSIAQNDALFALIGTTYGGDGQTTFALPDFRSRIPIHQGTGSSGTTYTIGENGGTETVTLTVNQLPAHTHPAKAQSGAGNQAGPGGNVWASSSLNQYNPSAADSDMNALAITSSGGNQPHDNMMPFLAINFIIALEGIFPAQG
ncbi:MAG: phage tail protein [bacterium]